MDGKWMTDAMVWVAQAAVSLSWNDLEKGRQPAVAQFAQINTRDGFFIAAREPDSDFSWKCQWTKSNFSKPPSFDCQTVPLELFRLTSKENVGKPVHEGFPFLGPLQNVRCITRTDESSPRTSSDEAGSKKRMADESIKPLSRR